MSTILSIVVWLCSLAFSSAANIDDISFSNLEIAPLTSNKQPDQGWTASFDFTIADASSIKEGDEFSLSMPHVYRVKLSDVSQTTTISLKDGTEAFKCYVSQQAAYLHENTIFRCTALTKLSSYNTIDGSITFSLNFSNGNSKYEYELENAKFFKSGPMLVQLGDQMSDVVSFDSATFTENVLHSGRTTGYDSFESYHLGMRCPNGYFLGGTEKIDYDNSEQNVNLDCSSVQVYSSNDFNDWWFPQSYNDTNADVSCFGSSLWITLDEKLDNGEMVWVNALQSLPAGTNTVDHALQFQYSCFDTIANTTYATQFSTTREFIVYQGKNLATASANTSTTTTGWVSATTTGWTSTTTTGWTSIYASTYSTESTVTIGKDTQTTPEVIIHEGTSSTQLASTTKTGWTSTYASTYSTESTVTSGEDTQTTPEVIIHEGTSSTQLASTTKTGWTSTYASTYSTESTVTSGEDTQTTPEVIIHEETPSIQLTSTTVLIESTTIGWTDAVRTVTSHFTSSFPAMINSIPRVSSSVAFKTSDASISSTKSEYTTIIANTTSVSPGNSETIVNETFASFTRSFFYASPSCSLSPDPSFSMSAPPDSSLRVSKSLSSLAHTSGPTCNSSMETKNTEAYEYATLTTSKAGSSPLSGIATSSHENEIGGSSTSSLIAHYSSAPYGQPSSLNLQLSPTSTSIISIYEGDACTFPSSELSSIFFLVISCLLC
ncbi:Sag1p SKDI_10G2110 [Saccharomyces kudriavzevii IFO 1802]|uniref:Uncharacterized protein n=2 Tax=Saccharomyces kudriavzevii (strain ATCC MYA-4449 / AS 2.2408 / CBS 8840 / NBRC 1802 / NCYC 2889) TaxID=226230 RepID=A0AA35NIF6_SACK1|nr:uncharacterized protein SKDI_10G2110 [Saccharomyces kudriavzevii IFO 1802]EJT42031.1 SAG1-like protein [Saccharomyces kudriavzevii IFO 1802]CAI4043808.1 hypothetical protein SKDI_10G2110 [Saccharomyces kudriavzevii IFO 1802]